MKVPFLDLKAQYESIKDEVAAAMQQVLEKTAFAGGPFVAQFEKEFAAFCKVPHAIGVGSGTDALWLALLGLGIGPGDEVITVPDTFIATAEAISYCGAKPVFVDVEEKTYNMNPSLLEAAITPKTKAIIPVHLFGQMADMDPIMEIAGKHGLFVIGDAGAFSFYPGKNLGAYGEAGAVVTNNTELDIKIRILRDHGQAKKYYHGLIGWNARMDGLQGAILSVKLKYLPSWNKDRRKNAKMYDNLFGNIQGMVVPREVSHAKHVYHIYAIRVQNRDALIGALAERDIHCGIHYAIPLHLQEAYHFLGLGKGSFPVSEKVQGELVSLPMFPELTREQIDYVAGEIKKLIAQKTLA